MPGVYPKEDLAVRATQHNGENTGLESDPGGGHAQPGWIPDPGQGPYSVNPTLYDKGVTHSAS